MENIWFLRDDGHLIHVGPEEPTDLGELGKKRLGNRFDLADEALEQQLRQENDLAWNCGDYWLLYQTDRSVWLTVGADRVLHLDAIQDLRVPPQTAEYFGNIHYMSDYPLASGLWKQDSLPFVPVSEGTTLVFTGAGDVKSITVVEEYHQTIGNGSQVVTEKTYVLEQTRDYGYELPIVRRGVHSGDWIMYRVDLGLSSYVFCVRFGQEAPANHTVIYSEDGASITLTLPAGWNYAFTSLEENDYCAGITFWPTGREEGKIFFGYYPSGFGVCGTGLETEEMELAGKTVSVGTYDGAALWDFISFGESYAVWGQGHEHWWAEYGETAMEILDSADFGK